MAIGKAFSAVASANIAPADHWRPDCSRARPARMIASNIRLGCPRSYMSQMNGRAITDGRTTIHQAFGPGIPESRSDIRAAAHQLAVVTRAMARKQMAR